MLRFRSLLCGSAMVGLLSVASTANAALITGNFGIGGSVTYDNLFVPANPPSGTNFPGASGLDFSPTLPPPDGPSAGFVQVTIATGYFAGLGMTQFVTTGQILNIANTPVGGNYTYAPPGVVLGVNNFLSSFSGGAAGLHYDLLGIPLQSGTGCPSTPTCVEGPFTLTELVGDTGPTGVVVSFRTLGNFVFGADSGLYTGTFTIAMDGLSLAEIGTRLANGTDLACGLNNTAQPCNFTANFTPFVVSEVPEPATLLTFGAGALVVAVTGLRRRKNKKA